MILFRGGADRIEIVSTVIRTVLDPSSFATRPDLTANPAPLCGFSGVTEVTVSYSP